MKHLDTLRRHVRVRIAAAIAVVAAIAVAAAAIAGTKTVLSRIDASRTLCAEFTDAVGLYVGNQVALLGVDIGTVTAISNRTDHVRVDFTVPADIELPADVGAVTYARSVVTDRGLELTKPYADGPTFSGTECIALKSTRTPVGISESLNAVGRLADSILGAGEAGEPSDTTGAQAINDSLKAAARSVDGAGGAVKRTLASLVTMIGDPYRADAEYRKLIENSQLLTTGWLKNWDNFAIAAQSLPDTARLVEGLSDHFATALQYFAHLVPILVEQMNRFAPRIYHNITDKAIPWVRDLLNAWTPNIVGSINALPPFTNWLADIYQPEWGTHNLTYIPPQVTISPAQASAICSGLRERNTPGSSAACTPGTATDPITLGLTNLIMGGALG